MATVDHGNLNFIFRFLAASAQLQKGLLEQDDGIRVEGGLRFVRIFRRSTVPV